MRARVFTPKVDQLVNVEMTIYEAKTLTEILTYVLPQLSFQRFDIADELLRNLKENKELNI